MTSHNEICEKCGHFGEIGWCIKCKGFYQNGKGCKDLENNFTPRIEKTEVQTICPLGETIPDFTQEIEKTEQEKFKENNNHKLSYDEVREGSSSIHLADRKPFTPDENCEICKDYPKEYWCGNPENKLSLKEQEVSKTVDYWENELKKCEKFWTEKYQTASDNWKHWYDENKKNKECLSSLQEKILKLVPDLEIMLDPDTASSLHTELQKIFKEVGQ